MANSILYGLLQSKDLAANLTPQNIVITIDRDLLITVAAETIAQHNEEVDFLRGLLAKPTTDYTLFYRAGLTNDLQEGDENQDPEPVKGAGYYSIGFPIRIATTKWGANYTTLHQMTVDDFSNRTDQMLIADVNWNRKWLFGTLLFDGTDGAGGAGTLPYTFADPRFGNISVYGLANGDATLYEKFASYAGATDNHYTAQNGAISDTAGQNPFPTIQTALQEHPDNGTTVVSFIAPGLETSVRGLAGFYTAPILHSLAKPGVNTAVFSGDLPITLPPKARFIGVYDQVYVVSWPSVPANHVISIAPDARTTPLLYRQFPQPALQGFAPKGYQEDMARGQFGTRFPYLNEVWYRAGGYGAFNRTAAHVHQIGSSTSYTMNATYAALFGR